MTELLVAVLVGIVTGAFYGLLGWARLSEPIERTLRGFNGYKFSRALIIGAIVGGIAAYKNISLDMADDILKAIFVYGAPFGVTVVLDQACIWIGKKMKRWLRK